METKYPKKDQVGNEKSDRKMKMKTITSKMLMTQT